MLKKFLYSWRMPKKFSWFYESNLVGIRGDFCFQDEKSCISILHYAIFLLLQKSSSIPSLLFLVKSVWLHSLKGMNKFHFLRSLLLQINCSEICLIFTGKHLCWRLFLKVTGQEVFSCEICKIFKNAFFHRTPPLAASVTFK